MVHEIGVKELSVSAGMAIISRIVATVRELADGVRLLRELG
jgi:hypothetical protein